MFKLRKLTRTVGLDTGWITSGYHIDLERTARHWDSVIGHIQCLQTYNQTTPSLKPDHVLYIWGYEMKTSPLQAEVVSVVWAFRRLKEPRFREMSARGYALHCPSCPQLSLPFSP